MDLSKIKLGLIFGGTSVEHDVSIASGTSILTNLNKSKYDIYPIYIDKQGNWYHYLGEKKQYQVGESLTNLKQIDNVINELKKLDKIFPILHGINGEDGTIQGLLSLLNIPYVGSKVLASSLAMDKVYAKTIFSKANINQGSYEYIKIDQEQFIYVDKEFNETNNLTLEKVCNIVETNLKYPMFVKPSNSGSSIGINKATNQAELKKYIKVASKHDYKILIEEAIIGREIECSILGTNNQVIASTLGEIKANNFYCYDSKYKNNISELIIPAELPEDISNQIKDIAIKTFKAIDGKDYARVDFFVTEDNQIYINEINTIPGFTEISMYPKLCEASGIKYSELLDKLITSL